VRRWLGQELLAAFGLPRPMAGAQAPQLAACSVEEASAALSLVQGMLRVVNVSLELGGERLRVEGEDLTAFRVTEILRHTSLQTVEQVIACLDTISAAVRRVCRDSSAFSMVWTAPDTASSLHRPRTPLCGHGSGSSPPATCMLRQSTVQECLAPSPACRPSSVRRSPDCQARSGQRLEHR
jgi:hypothetical protein